MTAAVLAAETWRIGSTTPRLHTPPLAAHVDPDAEYGIKPEATWGYDCIDFLENIAGMTLMPWQKLLYCRVLEKQADGTGFRFQTVVVMISRQNGKTKWLRGLGLWRLYLSETGSSSPTCPGAKLAIWAAQNLSYSENSLREVAEEIKESRLLGRELVHHRVVNGGHKVILTNGRTFRAVVATRRGGRGLSVDLAIIDELREFTTFEGWDALTPTTIARPYSQIVCATNAGDSRSEVLISLRDGCLRRITTGDTEDSRVGLFEWSIAPEDDPRDQTTWHKANPSLGLLNQFSIDTLQGRLEAMERSNMAGFLTEYLCLAVQALEAGIIPMEHWDATVDPESRRATEAPLYAAVDINYDRSRAYIAVAARREDGNLHTEVIAAAAGTDWIIPWLRERKGKFAAVTVQEIGAPASMLIDEIKEAELAVVPWGPGREVQAGCSLFYDGVVEHTIFHRPAPLLDKAAAAGSARHSGDSWIFDRRNSPVDVSPMVACAAAVWLEAQRGKKPAEAPQCHEWPDDDVINQWEQEARERWGN